MAHTFSSGEHLPHRRESGDPPDPNGLPRQRAGQSPQMHGRFPDYDVMSDRRNWDGLTRSVLEERVARPPECRFFSPAEQAALAPFLDVVLAQDREPRIPVLAMVDQKFAEGKLDGYRYEDMPPDPETWRRVAAHLAEDDFASLDHAAQKAWVGRLAQAEFDWEDLNVSRAWSVVMRGALEAFYSHPWAFNEIGFGGPAYPRGYMRRNMGPTGVDPDEPKEAFGLDPVRDLSEQGA